MKSSFPDRINSRIAVEIETTPHGAVVTFALPDSSSYKGPITISRETCQAMAAHLDDDQKVSLDLPVLSGQALVLSKGWGRNADVSIGYRVSRAVSRGVCLSSDHAGKLSKQLATRIYEKSIQPSPLFGL